MSVLHAEVLEAFRSIDVPEEKAIRAATALSASLSKVEEAADKGFFKRDADIEVIRKDVTALKVDTAVVKWMVGFMLAMQVAVLFKLFLH